jgi:hypothetical protein
MAARQLLAIVFFSLLLLATTSAANMEWRKYRNPATGLSVDVPTSIFTEDAGPPEGTRGRVYFTGDHRADLTIRSVPNSENNSPAVFLAKMRPPAGVQYRKVTSRFFVVSSIRNGRTWYNRCNRADGFMNCILINYPAAEDRQWDAVVTRISLSLSN